jgi:hypothetical protein
MLTGLLFQLPGLVIMTLVGVGAASFLKTPAPWLRGATAGLGAAGVALVAASAFALTRGACRGDGLLLSLSAASAVVTFYTVKIWLFPVLILAGGLVTLAVNSYRRKDMAAKTSGDDEAHVERFGLPRAAGALVVVLWAAVLVATLVAASKVPDFPMSKSSLGLDLWSAMFRAGSMIFGGEFFSPNVFSSCRGRGFLFFSHLVLSSSFKKKKKKKTGGQVVIPLLYKDVVQRDCDTSVSPPKCVDSPDTWVSSSDFYLGLSVVQGESFSFHYLFSPFSFAVRPLSSFLLSLSLSLLLFLPLFSFPFPFPPFQKKTKQTRFQLSRDRSSTSLPTWAPSPAPDPRARTAASTPSSAPFSGGSASTPRESSSSTACCRGGRASGTFRSTGGCSRGSTPPRWGS